MASVIRAAPLSTFASKTAEVKAHPMPGVVLSVRLSPTLAAGLEDIADRVQWAPRVVVDALLLAAKGRDAAIRQALPEAPFTERRTFRVSKEAADVLRSAGAPSWYGRQVIAYFLANPYALHEVLGVGAVPAATSPTLLIAFAIAALVALVFVLWRFVLQPAPDERGRKVPLEEPS